MNTFLWGVYPYLCLTLFFLIPIIRMIYRPFSITARSTGLFNKNILGIASLLLHWGILILLLGHLLGLLGGLIGSDRLIRLFFWLGLLGGFATFFGVLIALIRRIVIPEVYAMSQFEDYLIHLFLLLVIGLALYQVVAQQIFGLAYPAASWFASLWTLSPQPELMASASMITKWHIFLALTFFAYLPFTKLVHIWTYPINYFVRPYQSMRTMKNRFRQKWEWSLRSDKSFMIYSLLFGLFLFIVAGLLLGHFIVHTPAGMPVIKETKIAAKKNLMGYPLYVSQCARCHGLSGRGDGIGAHAIPFVSPPRDLVAGKFRFVSRVDSKASIHDLQQTIVRGFPNVGMTGFTALSDEQVTSLIDVIYGFWKDHPTETNNITIPDPPTKTAQTLAKGKLLYQANCEICHGATGKGDGILASKIKDWKGQPVQPANLAAGELKAGREPKEIYERIAAGIPGGNIGGWLMMPYHTKLKGNEIWSIVQYLEVNILPKGSSLEY